MLDEMQTTRGANEAQDHECREEDATSSTPVNDETRTELPGGYATPYPDDEDANDPMKTEPPKESRKEDEGEMSTTENRDERATSPSERSPPGLAVQRARRLADTIQVLRGIQWCSRRLEETVDADERASSTTKRLTSSYARQMRIEIGRYLNAPYDPFPEDA